MKKITEVRVILSVTDKGSWISAKTEEDGLIKSANALVEEVKKHCDYYEDHTIHKVYECEFCGHEWEDWSAYPYKDEPGRSVPVGTPRCCQKAADEWIANNLKQPIKQGFTFEDAKKILRG